MNLLEKFNKRREDKILKKIRIGKIDEQALIKAFKNSNDKTNFITQINLAMHYQLPQSLTTTILEYAKKDTVFLLDICPLMMSIDRNAIKDIIKSSLSAEDILSNPNAFATFNDDEKMELLSNNDVHTISPETVMKLSEPNRYKFISSLRTEYMSKDIIELLSDEQKKELSQKLILDNNVPVEKLNELLGKEYLQQTIQQMVIENPQNANDRLLSCVSDQNKSKIIVLSKLTYSLQKEANDKTKKNFTELYSNDKYFRKYLLFRYENNVNNISDNENNPGRSTFPLSDILEEYEKNEELIKEVFNSQQYQDERTRLYLKYYIQDANYTQINIKTVNELMDYPEKIFEKETETIKSGNRDDILEIVIKNLTGLSSSEYTTYKNMFLENHDLETILENTDEHKNNLKTLTIVKELINLAGSMSNEQLHDFASNISLRNYNELRQGNFSLVSTRETFRDFLSNIEQEYGKEINQNLGYTTKESNSIEVNGKKVNVHDLDGQFTLLIHVTDKNNPNHHENRTCMSLISEGHYSVAMEENGCKEDPDMCFFIFDNVPPKLLYASANHNMSSNSFGRANSNFMTTNNTILNAEPEIRGVSKDEFTEQTYYYQGFDKDGRFVRVAPTALATFQRVPNEHTLKLAAQYGLDILRIPDMQSNLEHMIEQGNITPSLVKAFDGDANRILEVLSQKAIFTDKEALALQALKGKEIDETTRQRIDELLGKTPQTKGKKEIFNLIDDITISDLDKVSAETKKMYELIRNPEISSNRETR